MSEEAVLVEKKDHGVALLSLNRPQTLNSWNDDMRNGLFYRLDALGADPEVRVIVITGVGRAFCAGADMGGLDAQSSGKDDAFAGQARKEPHKGLMTHPATIPKPVIACINGPAAGLGLAIACSCDFRFAAKDAKLTAAFSKLGLVAEHGLAWAVPHLVGTGNAMMFLMSSDVVTGQEAKEMGLVQKVFDKDVVLQETLAYATKLATTIPSNNLAVIKQQVYRQPLMERDDAMRSANRLMVASLTKNPDYAEGVQAFLKKRAPNFGPLDPNNKVIQAAEKEFGIHVGKRFGSKL